MNDKPQIAYTPREAAEQLRVSVATVRRLTRAGKLKSSPVGSRPRYSAEELRRFLGGEG